MVYVERTDYNKVISIKLMIPGTCNAKCTFCYMKDYKSSVLKNQKDEFLNNYLSSLNKIISEIGDKNPISLDITGNEPTFDIKFLQKVLTQLKEENIKNKVQRITMTTNGFHLKEIIPYLEGVVDYVNISVHDYRLDERRAIMGFKTFTDQEYAEMIEGLRKIGITTSAVSVIHKYIPNFPKWFEEFTDWCNDLGFISLRIRCDVFWNQKELFDFYMKYGLMHDDYTIIDHEETPDSHWCRLRRYDKFRVFFLKGVLDTSLLTKGIEYVVADDGICYCDFYKRTKVEDCRYEIGKIYDLKMP